MFRFNPNRGPRARSLCRGLALAAAGAALLLGVPAGAQDLRFDAETGRSTANWPPDRHFDHRHMRLELDIPSSMLHGGDGGIRAVQTLTLEPIGRGRDRIRLDARDLEIGSVRVNGRRARFEHDGSVLLIYPRRPLAPGRAAQVDIEYTITRLDADGFALSLMPPRRDGETETDRHPMIFSQGQPQHNSRWFPCHDFPNDRLTTELLVTVDEGFKAISNGRLIARAPAGRGRERWHWLQDKPHTPYLVTLVVGVFETVDLAPPPRSGGDDRPPLPMRVYTKVGKGAQAAASFAATGEMVTFFEDKFGEPYPWDRYDQIIVRGFRFGAMENTAASTFFEQAADMPAGTLDDIIAHELVHQWFGNLITCRSWEHLWLNEGWASLGEALWAEEAARRAGGDEAGRLAYQRKLIEFLGVQRGMNRTYAPRHPAMVSRYYTDPLENFMKTDNVYAKGGIVLHMLRARLGDDVFFAGTREYLRRMRFGHAETADFRRAMEYVSGQSLERFFWQWAKRPGLPRLDIEFDWIEDDRVLEVRVTQTQRIDADNPAYAIELPIYVAFGDDRGRYITVRTEVRDAVRRFELPRRPSQVAVDPNLTVLAGHRVRKPLAMWIEELDRGPTLYARFLAAEALLQEDAPAARAALGRVAGGSGCEQMDEILRAMAPALCEADITTATGAVSR